MTREVSDYASFNVSGKTPISVIDRFRNGIIAYLPSLAFLLTYFVTVVIGNLIYTTPSVRTVLSETGTSDRFLSFPETFSFGFWLLLFLPFLLTLPVVMITRRFMTIPIERLAAFVPEFSYVDFILVTAITLGVALYAYWKNDIYTLFFSGNDFVSSVMARFSILERLGFVNMTVVQALLPYLAYYAIIRAIKETRTTWRVTAIMLSIIEALLLAMLNMKWPVLLFIAGIVLCIFLHTRHHPFLKGFSGLIVLLLFYGLVSFFVFRVHLNTSEVPPKPVATQNVSSSPPSPATAIPTAGKPSVSLQSPIQNGPRPTLYGVTVKLFYLAVNRMAAGFPYYYHTFTSQGAVCGGILEQLHRPPPCRPSNYIYSEFAPNDGMGNKGTVPEGVHIMAYALGGWPLAVIGTVMASFILGLFMTLPRNRNASIDTFYVIGALTGYHFSQASAEDALFYQHGLLWTSLLLLLLIVVHAVTRRLAARGIGFLQ